MRWLNRDPLEEEGGVNIYAFCANDALLKYDKLGLSAFVLIYDSADPMFRTWAEDTRRRILAGDVSRYNSRPIKYDSKKDTIKMVSVTGVADISGLASIKDIKYLASFGHGRDGKIWWGYMDSHGTGRSVAIGISGNRIFNTNIATRVSLSSLVLNYDKCGFLVELYHCRSGEDFEVDEAGNLLFNDDVITAPRRATSKSANTASVASALSGLLKPKFPGVPFSVVGSELGVSNGRVFNRGWPRPVGEIKRIEVTK